jgi:hypothetical protein
MMSLVFLFALLTQGIPVLADQSGTVTGVVRDVGGKPAPGIRVGAIPVPDSAADLAGASAMVSLSATDESGRYRLENIPPGRYYIAAGRVDFPTYYPGTTALARGTIISISPKVVVDGIDFAMQDSSARVAVPDRPGVTGVLSFALAIRAAVEGGTKLPVFSPNGFVVVRLTNTANGVRTDVPINAATTPMPSATSEFAVSVESVPTGYALKSITVGATDLRSAPLRLSTLTFAPSAVPTAPMVATVPLSITLSVAAPARAGSSGIRIAGKAPDQKRRSIYLSGKPGMFYSDGSFEFRGVAPGRYTVATIENPESPHPLGASIVVGNRDIDGVELPEVALLPEDIRSLGPSLGGGSNVAGSATRLPALHLAIVDEQTREPAGPGSVYLLGPLGTSFDLPSDGRFEFPRMLPGTYNFEIQVFRHKRVNRTVVIEDRDIDLVIATGQEPE